MCTGLHTDQAKRQLLEERQNLAAPKLAADNRLARRINAVNLENGLRKIQTDRDNFCHRKAPSQRFQKTALWHLDAGGGSRPQHQLRTLATYRCHVCFQG